MRKILLVEIQTLDRRVNEMPLSFELDFEAYLKTTQNLAYVAAGPRVVKTICTEGLECLQNGSSLRFHGDQMLIGRLWFLS